MENNNPVKRIRAAMRLNQPDFARLIDRSAQSVRNYEAGVPIPDDVTARLKTIAAENGLADIALDLVTATDFKIQRVIEPAETLISTHPRHARDHQRWLDMLVEILTSGNADVIAAIQSNLVVFHKVISPRKTKTQSPQKRASHKS